MVVKNKIIQQITGHYKFSNSLIASMKLTTQREAFHAPDRQHFFSAHQGKE